MQISLLLFVILSSIHWMVVNRSSTKHLTAISIIDELKSEHAATSVANLKDTQAKGTTTVKPLREKQKPNQNGAYMHLASKLVRAVLSHLAHVVNAKVLIALLCHLTKFLESGSSSLESVANDSGVMDKYET